MLNVAYYNIWGDPVSDEFRYVVLPACGSRSIMVTDVDVPRVDPQEIADIGITVIPTTVLRDDGKILMWIEGQTGAMEFDAALTDAIRRSDENYV